MTSEDPMLVADQTFREWWGNPAEVFQFDASKVKAGREPHLERLQILYWPHEENAGLSRLATVGMSSRMMRGVMHRAEITYRIRSAISPEELPAVVRFLANLAVHPFVHQTGFDWGHALNLPHGLPGFPGSEAVLFHSALPGDPFDTAASNAGPVRVLNLIPLSTEEISLQRTQGTPALVAYFERNHIDVLSPRPENPNRQ